MRLAFGYGYNPEQFAFLWNERAFGWNVAIAIYKIIPAGFLWYGFIAMRDILADHFVIGALVIAFQEPVAIAQLHLRQRLDKVDRGGHLAFLHLHPVLPLVPAYVFHLSFQFFNSFLFLAVLPFFFGEYFRVRPGFISLYE